MLSSGDSCPFVSCKPYILNESEGLDLEKVFKYGSVQSDDLKPLDWMESKTPVEYLLNGKKIKFEW